MEFKTGNVVKTPGGNIVIITSVNDTLVQWVRFDSENSSGISKLADEFVEADCYCIFSTDRLHCANTCSDNKFKEQVKGFSRSRVLAPTVKDYIINRMLKNFEF